MTYKTLLAVHSAHDTLEALKPASGMALELGAHLDVVVVNEAAVMPIMLLDNDAPGVSGDRFIRLLEQTDRCVQDVTDHLREQNVDATVKPACQQLGLIGETVAHAAVYADLVLMNALLPMLAGVNGAVLEGALLHAGRPVLLTPRPDEPFSLEPDKVLVAWDASPQAARAVQSALPLLKRASNVHVGILEDSSRIFDKRARLVEVWMKRHGVDVQVERIARDGASVPQALHDFALEAAPDLLVMGAYGHGRLRERVLGGATHSMLSALPCPTLLAR